jgi:uncharacterized damage-inducible protein DinB
VVNNKASEEYSADIRNRELHRRNMPSKNDSSLPLQNAHSSVLRALDSLDDADLKFKPQVGSRSLFELITHMYGVQAELGLLVLNNVVPAPIPPNQSVANLRTYVEACHAIARSASTQEDSAIRFDLPEGLGSPHGTSSEVKEMLLVEQLHHRGQLFTYMELLSKTLPDIYAYRLQS